MVLSDTVLINLSGLFTVFAKIFAVGIIVITSTLKMPNGVQDSFNYTDADEG